MKIKYGSQIILSKLPVPYSENFDSEIKSKHFDNFKSKIRNNDSPYLYNPIKYYLLGEYDVCYIALINNLKFAHKVFGHNSNVNDKDEAIEDECINSFVGYSGLLKAEGVNCLNSFSDVTKNKKYYVGIINLKINNGLLIGNGIELSNLIIDLLIEKIEKKDSEIDFVLSHTFAWFELSLIVFVNEISVIEDLLIIIRELKFEEVYSKISGGDNSLYNEYFSNDKLNASIVSDTHTHIGFNEQLIDSHIDSDYVRKFSEKLKNNNEKLKTVIEWSVKPGHESFLINKLKKSSFLDEMFDSTKYTVALGRTDFILKETKNEILNNFLLIREVVKKQEGLNLFDHVRGLKTKVYLKNASREITQHPPRVVMDISKKTTFLKVHRTLINRLNVELKSLMVSRSIRQKIIKIFSNYNNGISDSILFTYYLDFYDFLQELINYINTSYQNSKEKNFTVDKIEKHLEQRISVFKDAFSVRFLNGYYFENIVNFDLDYNVSIQQLLSAYTFFIKEYSKAFEYKYTPLVKINDNSTVSNYYAINYSIHHLTSPEFVFSTLTKEISNNLKNNQTQTYKRLIDTYENRIKKIINEVDDSLFDEMIKSGSFQIDYFINDCIRFILTFNLDPQKFYFWFWSYNLQNSSLFNVSGMFNEHHLRKEMLRFNLVLEYFSINNKFDCPVHELTSYWVRNDERMRSISKSLITALKKNLIDEKGSIRYIDSLIDSLLKIYEKRYNEDILSEDFSKIKARKENKYFDLDKLNDNYENLVFQKEKYLKNNKENFTDFDFIDSVIDDLLDYLFIKNNKKISSLKRSWETGRYNKQFENYYEKSYNLLDQTGSVFFDNGESMNDYFIKSAETLMKIIDFSLKNKKDFILEIGKKNG